MAEQTVSFPTKSAGAGRSAGMEVMGGMVGTLIAAEQPELVRTLTVTGSGFSSAGYVPGAMEDLVFLSPTTRTWTSTKWTPAHPDGRYHFPTCGRKCARCGLSPSTGRQKCSGSWHRLSSSSVMTITSAWTTQEFSRAVARGQLAVVPGTSHLVPMEKPDLFNQLVLDFTSSPVPYDDAPATKGGRVAAPKSVDPPISDRRGQVSHFAAEPGPTLRIRHHGNDRRRSKICRAIRCTSDKYSASSIRLIPQFDYCQTKGVNQLVRIGSGLPNFSGGGKQLEAGCCRHCATGLGDPGSSDSSKTGNRNNPARTRA